MPALKLASRSEQAACSQKLVIALALAIEPEAVLKHLVGQNDRLSSICHLSALDVSAQKFLGMEPQPGAHQPHKP